MSGDHAALPRDPYCLSPYAELHSPNFVWGEIDGDTFVRSIIPAYKEVVHWCCKGFCP